MSIISSALATIKKGSSALDKNKVEKGLEKSYKKESAKKFVGGGSNIKVGIKSVSRNIKKSKVGKGVGYSDIVNQLNGILVTTDGIKNTLLTDYANEVKKNRAEKRIANAEKRREREVNLESKSSKKGKGFSVPGFISKPASSIFDWILNFFGMTILGSLVNLGLDNFDKITKFFNDITGSGGGSGGGIGGGSGGGLKFGNLFWLIRAALYKLIIPKFFIRLALKGLGLLLSPLKLIAAPFRLVGGLIFNTLKFVGNTLFNWTSKIVNGTLDALRNITRPRPRPTPRPGTRNKPGGPSSPKGTSPSIRPGFRSPGRYRLPGQTRAGYSLALEQAQRRAPGPIVRGPSRFAQFRASLQTGTAFGGRGSGLQRGVYNTVRRIGNPSGTLSRIFGRGPANFVASNGQVFKQFGKVLKGARAIRVPVIGPLMVAALSMMSGDPLDKTAFLGGFTALGGAIGLAIPIPVVGMIMGEMIGQFVGEVLYEGFRGKGWGAAGEMLWNKLKELFQGGKETLKWIGGGFSRFSNEFMEEHSFQIPNSILKSLKWSLKLIPGIPDWIKDWDGRLPNLFKLYNPLEWLFGGLGSMLLKSFFPDGFVNTMKSAVTSFFVGGGDGSGESHSEVVSPQSTGATGVSQNLSGRGGKWGPILDLIGSVEGTYESVYPGGKIPGLTKMTIREAFNASENWRAKHGGTGAFGRYQLVSDPIGRAIAVGLDPDKDLFSPENQDKIAIGIITNIRGIDVDMLKNDPAKAQILLAQEWAGLPVGTAMQGHNRYVTAEQSYYAGDGKNASGTDTAAVRSAFNKVVGGVGSGPIQTPELGRGPNPNNEKPPSQGNSSSIKGSSSRSSSPSSVSSYASYEKGGDDSNTIVVTLPDRYYQSGSESSSLPILAMDSKSILNSYYKSQLVGFLYKQG